MQRTHRTARDRAFTAIISMPGHLLPGWHDEWADLLPHWHIAGELVSPSDVTRFFAGAVADPETPRVAFIRNSLLSLGSGYALGAEDRDTKAALLHDHAIDDRARERELEDLKAFRTRRNAVRRQTQADVSAVADDTVEEESVAPVLATGVSERTTRRDAMLRATGITRYGLCCPRCGRVVRDAKLQPVAAKKLYALGVGRKASCEHCGESLNQLTRRWDNASDREMNLWTSPAWETHYRDDAGNRVIPWGERPRSNPRYPLAKFIDRRYRGQLDVFVADEAHKMKAGDSAIGQAFGYMNRAARKTLALTGTLFGGKASDVYALLLRLGNTPTLREYGWHNAERFVRDCGLMEDIVRHTTSDAAAGQASGKSTSTSTRTEERPGITARLAMILQNAGAGILLKHMGFNLVGYTEELVTLAMPSDVAFAYAQLASAGKAIIPFQGSDALGSYLQSTLLYPYAPWRPKTIYSAKKQQGYTPDAFPADVVLPHHRWLATYCAEQIRNGRRVLIYAEHTGKDNILPDVAEKITALAATLYGVTLKPACLYSTTVKPAERRAWFDAREHDGTNVVLCNPRLVETGLNLIGWPSIVVLEPVYSLFTLAQAKRRPFRPTQTRDCEVTFLCYEKTMSEAAIAIVARKQAAAAIQSGDDLSAGLMEFDAGMSLFKELAKAVQHGETTASRAEMQAMFAQSAAALKAEMQAGTAGMLGIAKDATAFAGATPSPVVSDDCADTAHPVAPSTPPALDEAEELRIAQNRFFAATGLPLTPRPDTRPVFGQVPPTKVTAKTRTLVSRPATTAPAPQADRVTALTSAPTQLSLC